MNKVVFLDRDGCINVDHGYVSKLENWEWTEKVFEGLKLLRDAGFKLAVVTNQSGIEHGLHSEQDMHDLHDMMLQELKKEGIIIEAVAFCPDHRDKPSDCRKPAPGMAKDIEKKIGEIDYAQSWMIGDKEADVGFGKNNGTKTALIKSRYWQDESELEYKPDLVVNSLYDFAQRIVSK